MSEDREKRVQPCGKSVRWKESASAAAPLPQMSVCNVRLSGQILAWNEAPHWGKRKKIGVGQKKKKLASKASREVVWGAFPIPRLSLGSLRLPILFLFDPVFCLFPGAWSQPRQIYSVSAVVYPCLVVEGYSRRCHNDQIMKELKCCEQVLLPLL